MKKWSFVVLLLVGATVLGATVLREPIGYAASPFTNVIVGNDATNPVPVKQQGTADVNVTNTVASADVDQRTAVRFGPTTYSTGVEMVPVIPQNAITAGKKFIVTYFNLFGFSLSPGDPLVGGACFTRLLTAAGPESGVPFGTVPLQRNEDVLVASEPAFLPLNSGEGLGIFCQGRRASGTGNSQFLVSVGGYFATTG